MSGADFLPTIGVETHVQLKTKTKLFAAVGNDARQAPPNTLISHICVGMPGALPVLNRAAVELATHAAIALNTKPQKFSRFERKHYFYPDLPKGYQITQYENSFIVGGWVEIQVDGKTKKINVERANLEEDAGKNIHPAGVDYSLVDLNRAGTPLLEIVSRPDIHSAAEAKAYARELWLLMKYADVTDGDLYHGHVRFDVNISVSKDPKKLGIRTEIKNLNSFRSVEAAITYEIKRQSEVLEKAGQVIQETRGWDEAKQKTTAQRSKEEAEDYRYMPEPDIPPLELDDQYDEKIKKGIPKLPVDIRQDLKILNLGEKQIEVLIESIEGTKLVLEQLTLENLRAADDIAKWWIGVIKNAVDSGELDSKKLLSDTSKKAFVTVSGMLSNNQLSSTSAKEVLFVAIKKSQDPKKIAKEKNLLQVSNESAIDKFVSEVLDENPKVVDDVKKGEMKAIGFLVGQVMAKSKGQANPQLTQELIKKKLGI